MRPARRYILLFVILNCVYHSNLRPVASGDSLPAALIPLSILLDGSVTLNRFGPWLDAHVPYARDVLVQSHGNWYSRYPVAGPVLVSPLYLPLLLVPNLRKTSPEVLIAGARVAEKFVAVALASLTAVWMLSLLTRVAPAGWAWGLTWLFALATALWSTASQALWQHSFGLIAIVACLDFLDRRRYFWCGVAIAIAIAIRPTNLLLLPAVAAALWTARAAAGEWVRVLLPPVAASAAIAAFNWRVFGSLTGGYPARLDGNFLDGLAGVLVSPGRGLLVYTPVALFALAAFLPRAGSRHQPLKIAAAAFA